MTRYETWQPSARAKEADVGGLSIRRRKSSEQSIEFCEFGCRRNDGMRSTAGFTATLLGRETLLCSSCARDWPAIYSAALAGFSDAVEPEIAA